MIRKFILFIFISLFILFIWMAWSMTELSSKQLSILPIEKIKFDENRLIKNLSDAITYKTISHEDSSLYVQFTSILTMSHKLTQ